MTPTATTPKLNVEIVTSEVGAWDAEAKHVAQTLASAASPPRMNQTWILVRRAKDSADQEFAERSHFAQTCASMAGAPRAVVQLVPAPRTMSPTLSSMDLVGVILGTLEVGCILVVVDINQMMMILMTPRTKGCAEDGGELSALVGLPGGSSTSGCRGWKMVPDASWVGQGTCILGCLCAFGDDRMRM